MDDRTRMGQLCGRRPRRRISYRTSLPPRCSAGALSSVTRLCQKITRATDSFFPVSLTFSPSLLHAAFAFAHPSIRLPLLSAFFPANDDIFARPFAPAWHGMVVAKKRALEKRRNTQFCPCHGVRNGICIAALFRALLYDPIGGESCLGRRRASEDERYCVQHGLRGCKAVFFSGL